jgi:uncharacterized membrane protein YhaH (DUF805 family)
MNYYLDAFHKYTEFSGRATRTQYWMFVLFNAIVSIAIGIITALLSPGTIATSIGWLYFFATLVPSLALGVRRLHDTDRSGWWILIVLIPLIGAIVLLVFLVLDSTPGDNSYGPNPKGVAPSMTATPQ